MTDPVTAFLMFLGLLSSAGQQQGQLPAAPPAPPPPAPPPPFHIPPPGDVGPSPAPAPTPVVPAPPTPTPPPMPPWPAPVVPAGLPPFPGPGWVADTPVSQAVADRATYWNPKLWDFPNKRIARPYVIEQFGGRWLAFRAAWHPGSSGPQTYMATEAFRLASAQPVQPSPVAPPPVLPATPAAPAVTPSAPPTPGVVPPPVAPPVPLGPPPGPVSPYPGTGAWQSNTAYVKRYQSALSWLAASKGHPSWDPQGVDGKYGAHTQSAVKAFQRDSGLAQDGEAGAQTAAALDAAMGLAPLPAPPPMPVVPPPQVPPAPPPAGPPPPVSPYPGTGAWQKNGAYITRYQNALTYLSQSLGQPSWNPQGVDGKYGPHTQSAVKAFQAAQSLPVDGQCGPTTAAALDHLLAAGSA